MPITIPKPNLLKPRIPGIAAVGLLVLQYFVMSSGNNPDPSCVLDLDYPHHSTYAKEYKGVDVIKLRITSTCNFPQEFTELSSSITTKNFTKEVLVHKFDLTRVFAMSKSPNTVVFEQLVVPCKTGPLTTYRGSARGIARLADGRTVKVSGNSGKYHPENCVIGAK
jgi:hypothetical protein